MKFKVVVNEPSTKKSYQVEKEVPSFIGMKIGDKFDGSIMGMNGFTLQVTGGSDSSGFPMRRDLPGTIRKKALLTKGVGFRGKKSKKVHGKKKYLKVKGMRKRKYIRGNTISDLISQVNCKVIEGQGDIELMLGIKKPEEKTEEIKPEVKEESKVEKKEEVKKEEKPKEEPKKETKPEEKKE